MIVNIYLTEPEMLDKTIYKLSEKSYESGHKVKIVAESDDAKMRIDKALWMLGRSSFLAHGTDLDDLPSDQPIYISCELDNPNNSDVLILTFPNINTSFAKKFARCLVVVSNIKDQIALNDMVSKLKSEAIEFQVFEQHKSGKWQARLC